MDAILGFTTYNDVHRPPSSSRPGLPHRAKSLDGFSVFGPWVSTDITREHIREGLAITGRVNGVVSPGRATRRFKFDPGQVLSHASRYVTLPPGDIIALGTPPPAYPIQPGDTVEADVELLGVLTNTPPVEIPAPSTTTRRGPHEVARLCTDGVGNSKLESLPLPFNAHGPTATDDDRAHAWSGRRPRVHRRPRTSPSCRRRRRAGERPVPLVVAPGGIDVAATDDDATLRPGDVLFVDDLSSAGHTLTYRDSRIVRIDVADSWTPHESFHRRSTTGSDEATDGKVTEMFVADGQADFRSLDQLFGRAGRDRSQADVGRVVTSLSPGSFGDWHTEKASSLVLVLTGGFELEVGGDGGHVEVFRAGDICLVQNRWGQGHITRTHGETRFAAVVVADEHLWVAPDLQPAT